MPVSGIKTVTRSQNGVGAFIRQCKRLDLHYCDWHGSSKGMNNFLQSSTLLPGLTTTNPQTEFRISPRPNRHPILRAFYINGREKVVCVRNLDPNQILLKAKLLLASASGSKNKKIRGRNVVSLKESVRGIWSPYHGGIKDV